MSKMMQRMKSLISLLNRMNTNIVVAGAALVISICALYVSIQEVRLMQVQQKANMYPHLTIGKVYNGRGFGIELKNSGNGLAWINSYQVFNDSIYFRDWMDVVQTLVPQTSKINYNVFGTTGSLRNKILTPNEEVELIFFRWTPETRLLEKYMSDLNIKLCYSSLLKEYWELSDEVPVALNGPCEIEMSKEFYGS